MKNIAQKIYGLILIALTITCMYYLHDATFAIITLPMGVYLLFTRQKVMKF